MILTNLHIAKNFQGSCKMSHVSVSLIHRRSKTIKPQGLFAIPVSWKPWEVLHWRNYSGKVIIGQISKTWKEKKKSTENGSNKVTMGRRVNTSKGNKLADRRTHSEVRLKQLVNWSGIFPCRSLLFIILAYNSRKNKLMLLLINNTIH